MRKISVLVLIFCFAVFPMLPFGLVKAQSVTDLIYIRADGTLEGTDKIQREGNIYTLTDDIFNQSIIVQSGNVVLDGAGYTLQGPGAAIEYVIRGIVIANPDNNTVKNFSVHGFNYGIGVFGDMKIETRGMTISRNNLTNNNIGIQFDSALSYINNTIIGNYINANNQGIHMYMIHVPDAGNNQIVDNQITNNDVGMYFLSYIDQYHGPNPFQMNNTIHGNNFVGNNKNVVNDHIIFSPEFTNIWDNGLTGNYWSNYNGTDVNGDGIGDTPYVINQYNQDNYPLVEPADIETIPEFPSWIILPLFVGITSFAIVIKKKPFHSTA